MSNDHVKTHAVVPANLSGQGENRLNAQTDERRWMGGARSSAGCADESLPFYRYLLQICLIIITQIIVLLLLNRQWFCRCGLTLLWQGSLDTSQNSQQISDPYSLSHVAFGCILLLWLRAIRPSWPLRKLLVYVVMSSALWEMIENLPFMVRLFSNEGKSLGYNGDSIINSLVDTAAVTLGFILASRLPKPLVIGLVAALEMTTYALVKDSAIVGLLRIIFPMLWQ